MKYMRKNSFVVCLVISAILLTSSFAMPVLAAENTGLKQALSREAYRDITSAQGRM